MSLIEHVLNHEVFKEIADQIDEEGRKEVEEQVKEMLENVDTLYLYVKDMLNTEDGINNLSEALHDALLSKEGQEEWLEKP